MTQTVIGVFDTNAQATSAKEALMTAGITAGDIDFSTYGEKGYANKDYSNHESGVSGFFADLFGTDDKTAHQYADVASRGTVVTVHTKTMEHAKKAAAILDQHGAIDFDGRATAYKATAGKAKLNDETIKVIEENIAVGKREVTTGGVTVRSRIVEKPVHETLRLRQEEVYVKRTPVDREATAADLKATTGNISVTETAEQAVVGKNARVVEEIEVGKKVNTRTEEINDTVRKTEVDIDKVAGNVVKKHDDLNKKR
ncbi:YsnF/AvaK domain-containing protein [Neolewinella antarctica]|uniref:Uncharacterized protein (TIGR02271 family) n=1 Tax=Neolewinella antarctica TaxID=442734 RepID=A0ABX0X6J7_9BACT|nr:YsnF/AvaK domain-containing protein [Neolewinella antarctica]NJC24757.1 uncharacterized protein (TIGR02271 family) [Neolewinella antarctica]